ncbi:MAG: Smr/MutS family protein [Acidobacteriota bacterium]|nr:Smr/MutS family protein [Acidobacteriota bacterium]
MGKKRSRRSDLSFRYLPGEKPEDEERELFLREMERLGTAPDKDRVQRKKAPPKPRKVKIPRGLQLTTDDRLDLHGLTVEQARHALQRFMVQARRHQMSTVVVVTGKGRRSPGGVSVLKRELERWLASEGAEFVRAYGEAPRSLGGAGAFVLHLR